MPHRAPGGLLALVFAALLAACTGSALDDTAITRGDVAFARDSLDEALAEYLLAARQNPREAEVLARVAATYLRIGRLDQARNFYRLAVEQDEAWADQAASDFIAVARDAAERNDRFQLGAAVDAAAGLRPGISVPDLALPLARHYYEAGQYGRALPYYQKALATAGEAQPQLMFEMARAHEQIGDCEQGLAYFERFRATVQPGARGEVDWYIGSCAFRVASDLLERRGRDDATLREALRLLGRTVEMGEPRNLLGRAWFERGDILAELGECDAALAAFDQVRRVEPSDDTALAREARERYDDIRFGRGMDRFRRAWGGCG